jgi:hypothetical protein
MLLAVVAVVAFFKWLSGGPRRWAWIYVAGAVVAPYFHLAVLPVVLSPILFGLADRALRRRPDGGRTPGEVVAIGAAVGAGLAAVLSVPLIVDAQALAQKTGMSRVRWATLKSAAHLFAGTSNLRLERSYGRSCRRWMCVAGSTAAAIALTSRSGGRLHHAAGGDAPPRRGTIVLARYSLRCRSCCSAPRRVSPG